VVSDLGFIFLLILANGIFAAAEIALVSARDSRLRQLAEDGDAKARRVLELRRDPERLLATVQVGITAISSLAAVLGGARISGSLAQAITPLLAAIPVGQLEQDADKIALALVVTGISFVTLVAGELVPKSLAMRHAEPLARWMAGPLQTLAAIGRPLVWILTTTSNILLRPFGDRTSFSESRVNLEELRVMIEEAARSGAVDPRSGDIAARALDFSELTASEIAVPRNLVRFIDLRAETREIARIFTEEGFHRMPVVDGTPDKVVGYVSATDVLTAYEHNKLILLKDIIRPVLFVPATTTGPALLKVMQEKKQRLAIVVDEHGGVDGLITLEDVFEELVGQLYSEGDPQPDLIKTVSRGHYLVAGMMPIREMERATGLRIPDDVSADTVAGVVLELAGEIPRAGAEFEGYGATWRVTARTERRVKQVEVLVTERNSEEPRRTPIATPVPPKADQPA